MTLTVANLCSQIKRAECQDRRFIQSQSAWVYQAFHAVKVPIIGMGGIASAEDAIEMILAGASAVSVGTANFHNPSVTMEIVDGIQDYMKQYGFTSVNEMVGLVD